MLEDLGLGRDHFFEDPFLLQVFDEIAQLAFIALTIRKQSKTFKNANLTTSEIRADVVDAIECLEEISGELLPLLFSRKPQETKTKMLVRVRKRNGILLTSVSVLAERLSTIEREHYEGRGASGNVFRAVQYRVDVIRKTWSRE